MRDTVRPDQRSRHHDDAAHGHHRFAGLDRVTLVHERLTEWGGSEAVVDELAQMFADPEVFVPIASSSLSFPSVPTSRLRTSWLQRLYSGGDSYAQLLPLLPAAMRSAHIDDADVVIFSHHAFSQRCRVPAGVPTVSYVHTPARWIWQAGMRTGEGGPVGRAGLAAFAATQRAADRRAAQRITEIVANSSAVADRIRRWWGRESTVVHPPVDTEGYTPDPAIPREDFFLLAGRMVPYKVPHIAVEAARRADVPLVVVGNGRSRAHCEEIAGPNTRFLGRVDQSVLLDLFRRCRALVFPGEEDFGIVPVEAQACGAPVIALGSGGALDTVVPGRTGTLVDPTGDRVEAFAKAMVAFDGSEFDSADVRRHAETFSREAFRAAMTDVIATVA